MQKFFSNLLFVPLKIFIVITINFLIFIIIPLTHNLFGLKKEDKKDVYSGAKIIAEMIKPPKKEEKKQIQRRTREVKASNGNQGRSNKMPFDFTPDLSIRGGEGVAIEQQGKMEAIVFEEGEVDENATLISSLHIPYPARALELGIEGILEANLTIGIDGKVTNIDIISSPHSSITNEARKVFNDLKFKPARNKGIPVIMKLKQVVEFKLDS